MCNIFNSLFKKAASILITDAAFSTFINGILEFIYLFLNV